MFEIESEIGDLGSTTLDNEKALKPYIEAVKVSFLVLFVADIALIFLGILAAILMKFCSLRCCACLLHASWTSITWLLIIGMLAGSFLFVEGVLLDDTC